MAMLSFLQLPFDFSRPHKLQIWNLRQFLGQIKLSLCIFYEPFLRMGFTNIYVNHIDIKLVFTDRVSFLQFPFVTGFHKTLHMGHTKNFSIFIVIRSIHAIDYDCEVWKRSRASCVRSQAFYDAYKAFINFRKSRLKSLLGTLINKSVYSRIYVMWAWLHVRWAELLQACWRTNGWISRLNLVWSQWIVADTVSRTMDRLTRWLISMTVSFLSGLEGFYCLWNVSVCVRLILVILFAFA